MEEYKEIYSGSEYNLIGGILGAVVGALLGAVLWTLVGMLGYIASIVGFLIAFLASKGYDLLHGRPGACKLVTLIVCVILAVLVGTAGTAAYQLHQVYVEENYSLYVTESVFFKTLIPALMEEPDFTGSIIKDSLMGIAFAILGCFGLLKASVAKPQPETAETPLSVDAAAPKALPAEDASATNITDDVAPKE